MTMIPDRRRVPSLRDRKISLAWAVGVSILVFFLVGLIGYRLEQNSEADRRQTDEIVRVALANQYQLCADRVAARESLGGILTGGNESDRTQYQVIDEFVDGLPPQLLFDLNAVLDAYQAEIDAAYPRGESVDEACAEFLPPGADEG